MSPIRDRWTDKQWKIVLLSLKTMEIEFRNCDVIARVEVSERVRYFYLGNVLGFEKVIDIKEHFDGHAELKEVVDNPLDPVGGLHLVGGERPLFLAPRGRAALEDHLLNDPG